MSTAYDNTTVRYEFTSDYHGTVFSIEFATSLGITETDLDNAVTAFTESLFPHYSLSTVKKYYDATGTSDWVYTTP